MRRTVVWLMNRQVEQLTTLSKQSLAPVSALVRHAVNQFLERKRKHLRRKAGQRKVARSK
jgi:hypothetical protein